MDTMWRRRSRQLKPSFNKSGQNSFQRRKRRLTRQKPRVKTAGPRHGNDQFGIPFTPRRTAAPDWQSRFAEFRAFWRQFFARAFNPYRPELHYMRGPGPAWRAKHLGRSH